MKELRVKYSFLRDGIAESRRGNVATNWRTIIDKQREQSGAYDLRGTAWSWWNAVDRRTRSWSKR